MSAPKTIYVIEFDDEVYTNKREAEKDARLGAFFMPGGHPPPPVHKYILAPAPKPKKSGAK